MARPDRAAEEVEIAAAGKNHDQQDGEQKGRDRIANDNQCTAPDIKAAAVADRFADAQRNGDQIDNQRAPQPEAHRDRQAVFNQLQHGGAAKQAVAEIKAQIIAQHLQIAFVQRFIEAVAVGDLGDDFRVEAAPAAIVTLADIACAGAGMAGAHPAVASPGIPPR